MASVDRVPKKQKCCGETGRKGPSRAAHRVIWMVPGQPGLLPVLGLLCDEGALEALALGSPDAPYMEFFNFTGGVAMHPRI